MVARAGTMEKNTMMPFKQKYKEKDLRPYFELVQGCKGVAQALKWHPEGDVYTHSMQTLHIALRESNDPSLIIAALVHDVGKIKGSFGHEQYSVCMLDELVSDKTLWLVQHHMRIWNLLMGEMRKRNKVQELIQHQWLADLVMLARWDKMARKPNFCPEYDANKLAQLLNAKIK